MLRPLCLLACLAGCSAPDGPVAKQEPELWIGIAVHRAWLTPEGGLVLALQAQSAEQSWQAAQLSISPEQMERAFAAHASSLQAAAELELPASALRGGPAPQKLEQEPGLIGLYIVRPGPGDFAPEPLVETGMSVHAPRDAWHFVAGQRVAFGVSRHWDEPGGPEYARFGIALESIPTLSPLPGR